MFINLCLSRTKDESICLFRFFFAIFRFRYFIYQLIILENWQVTNSSLSILCDFLKFIKFTCFINLLTGKEDFTRHLGSQFSEYNKFTCFIIYNFSVHWFSQGHAYCVVISFHEDRRLATINLLFSIIHPLILQDRESRNDQVNRWNCMQLDRISWTVSLSLSLSFSFSFSLSFQLFASEEEEGIQSKVYRSPPRVVDLCRVGSSSWKIRKSMRPRGARSKSRRSKTIDDKNG